MKKSLTIPHMSAFAAPLLLLAACNETPEDNLPSPDPTVAEEPEEPVSIIRSDVEVEKEPLALEPLMQRISFDDGGGQLSLVAISELQAVLKSDQMEAGGPIVLRGHTDAGGRDEVNMRASQDRAELVRDWLVEKGISEERITIIAMGEQNPARPNAKPDGTPDEANRAYNRRVDLTIDVPSELKAQQEEESQSFIEQISAED